MCLKAQCGLKSMAPPAARALDAELAAAVHHEETVALDAAAPTAPEGYEVDAERGGAGRKNRETSSPWSWRGERSS